MRINPEIRTMLYADGCLRVIGRKGRVRFSFVLEPDEKHTLLRYLVHGKPDTPPPAAKKARRK